MFMTLFAGVKFIFRPVMEAKKSNKNRSKKMCIRDRVIRVKKVIRCGV